MILIFKGGKGSGWYAPPKGTHSGGKHRSVGSGRVVKPKSSGGFASTAEASLIRKYGELSLYDVGNVESSWISHTGKYIAAGREHNDSMSFLRSEFGMPSNDAVHDGLLNGGYIRLSRFRRMVGVTLNVAHTSYRAKVALRDALTYIDPADFTYMDHATRGFGHDVNEFFRLLGMESYKDRAMRLVLIGGFG